MPAAGDASWLLVEIGAAASQERRLTRCHRLKHELRDNRPMPSRRAVWILVAVIVLLVVNHMLARMALNVADAIFLQIDKVVDDEIAQPSDVLAAGSPQSLVDWDSIGQQGKTFITGGPTQEQISQFWGREALRPLRVYVGLRSEESVEERARLALGELIRVGGFERSVLVVATPTGTGWLDPGAVDTVEYVHRGDTAIVAMQYSYLPSWITILVDPHRSRDAAEVARPTRAQQHDVDVVEQGRHALGAAGRIMPGARFRRACCNDPGQRARAPGSRGGRSAR